MPLRYADAATEAYAFPLTIRHLLKTALATASAERIVYRDQASYSYGDFVGRVGRLASMLQSIGADQGMTVAVMDWDSHRYLEAYFAIPMMGAVLQTVNVRMPVPQIAFTLQKAQAEILLVHRDFFPIVEAVRSELPGLKAVIAIADGVAIDTPAWAVGEYEAMSSLASPDYPFEDLDENAIATTFFTTGTTGDPKGVCFTHRQLVLHTLALAGQFGAARVTAAIGMGDVYMPLTPMFHVHAWGVPYLATMLGLKQVYPGRYEPALLCRLRVEHGVTYSHCVSTILEMLLQAAEATRTDLAGWKITVGAAALPRQLCAKARALGMEIGTGYGMSETGPLIARTGPLSPEEWDDEEATLTALTLAGMPAPLVEMMIVDEEMKPLPHDGEARGELMLRAPWLTPGYVDSDGASAELWRGGWLHTQDIASIDSQGRLRIRDRLKDVIKTGGEWIDSILLEELVATAEGVADAAVIAVPDERWNERPLAVIIATPGAVPTLEAINAPVLRAITRGQITKYAKLGRFEIVAELPRTSVGKIDKKRLRAMFAA